MQTFAKKEREWMKPCQGYRRTLKQLMIDQRLREHPKSRKKVNAAALKIDTITGRIVRDIKLKLRTQQKGFIKRPADF